MIHIQAHLEKPGIHKKQEEIQILVELQGEKKSATKKKQKLNIALTIDISGSMGTVVKNITQNIPRIMDSAPVNPQPVWPQKPFQPWAPNQPFIPPSQPWLGMPAVDIFDNKMAYVEARQKGITRLDQAKDAARKAIAKMSDGDFVSLVTFDHMPQVLVPATELTATSRILLLNAITAIQTGGSTNLHGGWLHGATEVAKKMSNKYINRVILLTDGQTNAGVQDPALIAKDVAGLYEKSISTTTFGIGAGFNEDLLQKMANAGGGNFYYISDENQLSQMFEDEFTGLSNICGSEVSLALPGMEVLDNPNGYEKKDGAYLMPNIGTTKISALFRVKVANIGKTTHLGDIVLSYKNEEGLEQKVSLEIKAPLVSKKEWDELPIHEEVKVQETLLVIAKNKIAATQAIDIGNLEGAQNLLAQSALYASASGLQDARICAESTSLDATIAKSASLSAGDLRKDLSFQSYKTRYSK